MDFLDLPLEAFSPQMVDQALDEEARIMDLIKASDQEIETVQGRILETREKRKEIAGLSQEIALARQDRSELLALGEDHSEISKQIATLQKKLDACKADAELLADEEEGLSKLLNTLQARRQGLVKSLESAQDDTKAISFCVRANEYNQKAQELAKIVSNLWEIKVNLPQKYKAIEGTQLPRPRKTWYNTALWDIPVLRKKWPERVSAGEYSYFQFGKDVDKDVDVVKSDSGEKRQW